MRDTPPFSILYTFAEPTITQLHSLTSGFLAGPLQLWQQAQTSVPQLDNILSVGVGGTLMGGILKYGWNKAKAKLETTIKQTTDELKNHTSELKTLTTDNETLTKQRDDVLTLASNLKTGYESKLTEKDALIEKLKQRERLLIQERNAAQQALTQKTQDAITEQMRVH